MQTNLQSHVQSNTMQAVISTKYGGPDVLELREVPRPTPKENEILIKVKAASVTAADSMIRQGIPYYGRLFLGLNKPKNPIPGTGFSGIIEAVGDQVENWKVGDAVFGESSFSFGTHAAYVCIPETGVVAHLPANMTHDEAAPVCDGALTSLNFLKNLGKIQAGQKVLINGASGSLGTAAVQLAKYYGAHVTGVCSTANVALVHSLGADQVIDYSQEDFTQTGQTYDLIYDTVGKSSFSACKKSLTPTGIYMSPVLGIALLGQMMWTSVFSDQKAKFSATGMLPMPELRSMLEELVRLIENGMISTVIDTCYPLDQITDAHRYVDSGRKKGSVVINF